MTTKRAGTYAVDARGGRKILGAPSTRRALHRIATRVGVPAFQAAAPVRTGDYRRSVRVEDGGTQPDGRAVVRIVAYPTPRTGRRAGNAPVPIEFGTSHQRGARALQRAVNAIERGR